MALLRPRYSHCTPSARWPHSMHDAGLVIERHDAVPQPRPRPEGREHALPPVASDGDAEPQDVVGIVAAVAAAGRGCELARQQLWQHHRWHASWGGVWVRRCCCDPWTGRYC